MPDVFDLTTWTDARPWISDGTRLKQETECLDLQFKYGTDAYRTAIRFLANGDLRLTGELVTTNGGVRSYRTFGVTVLATGQDVASFRSGPGPGTEVLRVESTGRLKSAVENEKDLELEGRGVVLYAQKSGTSTHWGRVYFDAPNSERVLDCSATPDSLRVRAQEIRLDAWDGSAWARWGGFHFTGATRQLSVGTSDADADVTRLNLKVRDLDLRLYKTGTASVASWALLSFDSSSNERVVDCSATTDSLRVRAQEIRLDAWDPYSGSWARWGRFSILNATDSPRLLDTLDSSGGYRNLRIEVGDQLELQTRQITLGSMGTWGIYKRVSLLGSKLEIPDHFWLQAKSDSTYKTVLIDCNKFIVAVRNEDCVKFDDENDVTRFKFTTRGQLTLTAKASQHADLTLDATASTKGRKWTIRSSKDGNPTGSLKFVNETDDGTPTVEIEPSGDLYTPGFVGCRTTTGAPSDSDGRTGAIAIDTTNKRIWVKVTDSGSNRWWYASLISQ